MDSHKEIEEIVTNISKFCSSIAEEDTQDIKTYYLLLRGENVNVAIMTAIHDIYVASINKDWKSAKQDALLIIQESANRYQDNYGLLSSNHGTINTSDSDTEKILKQDYTATDDDINNEANIKDVKDNQNESTNN